MTEIKCKVSDLLEICDLVSLKGKNLQGKDYLAVPEFLIESTEGSPYLIATASTVDNTMAIELQYKVDSVVSSGQLPIGDVEKFTKYLERFAPTDIVTIKTTENRITIERENPKKLERFPLAHVQNMESTQAGKDHFSKFSLSANGYPFSKKSYLNLKIGVEASELRKVIGDGEVVNQRIYPITVTPDVVTMKVGSDQTGEIETTLVGAKIDNDPEKAGTKSTVSCFANGLDNIFSNISGQVYLYMLDGVQLSPMFVYQETEKYKFKAFLAPVSPE